MATSLGWGRAWLGLTGAGALVSPPAAAIVIRHDVPPSAYVVDDTEYPGVVDLFEPGDCIGTLVDDRHLLTVAHCAEDTRDADVLNVNGQRRGVDAVFLHPKWNGWANDIAMIRLDDPVDTPPTPVYRGEDEAGATLTLVGRGLYATGLEGERGAVDDGVLRRATNVVTAATPQWLEVYFDDPDSPDVTALEGVGAGGDSGGPAFIQSEGGVFIAGLNSWGEGDGTAKLAQYGAWDYSTRVSTQLDWIDCVLGEEGAEDSGDASADAGTACPARRCGCASTRSAAGWMWWPALLWGVVRRGRRREARTSPRSGGHGQTA